MYNKSNLYYNKNLQCRANALRKNMTEAEACLWKYVLKARQMDGFQFRRQRPVLNYIADFMCKELMLIIEVDGITHTFDQNYLKDRRRQHELEDFGFSVIRFKDEEVLNNIDGVRVEIADYVKRIKNPPPKSPAGGG